MKNKLTALEWYHTKLAEQTTQAKDVNTIFLLAKGMEKEQIIKFANDFLFHDDTDLTAEQYYNETYGK
jgi:hypothetical protein